MPMFREEYRKERSYNSQDKGAKEQVVDLFRTDKRQTSGEDAGAQKVQDEGPTNRPDHVRSGDSTLKCVAQFGQKGTPVAVGSRDG